MPNPTDPKQVTDPALHRRGLHKAVATRRQEIVGRSYSDLFVISCFQVFDNPNIWVIQGMASIYWLFSWELVTFSWFFVCWTIVGCILGILKRFINHGSYHNPLENVLGDIQITFRPQVLSCLLWMGLLISVQFSKSLVYCHIPVLGKHHAGAWVLGGSLNLS